MLFSSCWKALSKADIGEGSHLLYELMLTLPFFCALQGMCHFHTEAQNAFVRFSRMFRLSDLNCIFDFNHHSTSTCIFYHLGTLSFNLLIKNASKSINFQSCNILNEPIILNNITMQITIILLSLAIFDIKTVNVVTKSVPSSGRSSAMSMASTLPVPTRATTINS